MVMVIMDKQDYLNNADYLIEQPTHRSIPANPTNMHNTKLISIHKNIKKGIIKEPIYIRVNNPSLNRNIDKNHLPHIWDEVLFNILKLKIE